MTLDEILKCLGCDCNINCPDAVSYCNNAHCDLHKERFEHNESALNQQEETNEFLHAS